MIGKLRIAWMLALALLAGPAFALGLGQIEVKSQRDQPLLAEIPIISSDPAELEQLQARLASPETFARIGLAPPQGIVSDLQFTIALDGQGRPVVRVTSAVPVQQPLLTFLVEVDWGQGRLVREYSALLDAPRTVSAPAQPAIQAPSVAPSNVILRPEAPPPAVVSQEDPATPAAPPSAVPPAPAQPLEAAPPDTAIATAAPTPAAPSPDPSPAPIATPPADSDTLGPVKSGETLGEIAARISTPGQTLDQTMLALLRTNPDAFIGGNINLVKQGAVLRRPDAGEVTSLGANEAAVLVRDQIEQWREARQPPPQPAAIAGDVATPTPARPTQRSDTPRVAGARLEIVPPSADSGRRAGTRSGINAGGEGDMLRQELQQTKETLAARDSEVQELQARVADLEKLQQQQQQLLALKNSELAAAQQRLATSNAQVAQPAGAASTAQPPATPEGSNAMMWVWGGAILVGLALVAAWLSRRRKVPASAPRAFSVESLAASIPSSGAYPTAAAVVPAAEVAEVDEGEEPEEPAFVNATPTVAVAAADPAPAPAWNADAAVMPTWHADPSSAGDGVSSTAPESPLGGRDRLELARAYIDLGDVDTARSLLREVTAGSDADARSEASRLLRELT